MKSLFMLIIILISYDFFAQQQDTISQDVKTFWEIVNENGKFAEKKESIKKQYSNEEIREIAVKLYNATEKDPFGFARYIITAHEKYKNDVKTDHNLIAPYPKFHILKQEINKVYGNNFGEILETPFFIRGKILKQIDTIYYSESDKDKLNQTKLIVQIEEIIKGKRFFKKGDIIEVNYLDWWVDYVLRLSNDSSYFMAIRLWGNKRDKLCLNNYSPGDLEIYPIINEIIEIRKNVYGNNTFGLGEKIEWKKFLTSFKDKYIFEGGAK